MASNPVSNASSPDAIRKNLEAAMAALAQEKSKPAIENHRLWPFHSEIETMKSKMKATYEEIATTLTKAGLETSAAQVTTFWVAWKGRARRRARATANA